jgi:pimeloyl-ACP methyl ester carboxylesterase
LIVLIPGAGGDSWSWDPVEAALAARGFDVANVDLRDCDDSAGLTEYADTVAGHVPAGRDCVLAALSLGAFVVPMVAARVSVRGMVLLNAMIPEPGETAGQWWGDVDSESYRLAAAERGGYGTDVDVATYFFHDVSAELKAEGGNRVNSKSEAPFTEPCDFTAWPPVPTIVLTGRDDRFFPPDLQRAVATARLGIEPVLVPGGHMAPVSQPGPIADHLAALAAG